MDLKSVVYCTDEGTPYLKEAGVSLISRPVVNIEGMKDFLEGYGERCGFANYLADNWGDTRFTEGSKLVKVAGQLCYASFGKNRTYNSNIDKYIDHIKQSGHGSLLEHCNYTLLLYGISRSLTHELVRHRAGFGFSQLSQRFVSGNLLRFVERPEFQENENLHNKFCRYIDTVRDSYEKLSEELVNNQKSGAEILSGEGRTELKKKLNQCSRMLLPNCTEAPIIVTGNARAWRHMLEARGSQAAEIEIRNLSVKILRVLWSVENELFSDYTIAKLPDGTEGITTPYYKI